MEQPPKYFKLGGHTITVKIRRDLFADHECYGRWIPTQNSIELQAIGLVVDQSFQNQTFWHEVFHAAFEIYGYEKHSKNEIFVDRMGQALHQVVSTFEE